MLCLKKNKKRSLWPDKLAAEIGKLLRVFGCFGKSNGNSLPKTCMIHVFTLCFQLAESYLLDVYVALNIGIRYVLEPKRYLTKTDMNHAFTWCFDYTIVLLIFMGLSLFVFFFTCSCCVYNGRRRWGDFSRQLGGVVPCGNDS